MLPGPYDVKVSLTGFRDVARPNVPVTIGQIARVDFTLEVGTVAETVMVVGESPLLQTDKADVHTSSSRPSSRNMPLNRFRNYQALINLVPGTTPMAFGNAETDTPARSLATNVNGQANTNNSTRTDGATNMNIWLPNHIMYVSPAETIDTVNVSTSSFDAEQGMAGGAAVTVITKSGTNKFKGSAFEFYNSDKLNAKPYFFGAGAVARQAAGEGEHLRRHARRADQEEHGVLLRIVRRLQARAEPLHVLQRAGRRRCARGLQQGVQHQRIAADHLQSVHRQRRRHRPPAVREQPDSGGP